MDIQTTNKLLQKVVLFSGKTFANTDAGKNYLTEKAISDAGLFTKYRMGCCDGSLINALPKSGVIIQQLEELGIIKNGKEYFADNIILPITDTENNIQNIVGINIKTDAEKYLFDDGERIFNLPIINSCTEIYQVENIIDLLSAEMADVNNIISGKSVLNNNEIKVRKIDKNINGILMNGGVDAVIEALSESKSKGDCRSVNEIHDPPNPNVNPTTDGFTAQYGLRHYEIIGLEKDKRKLKATVRISKGGKIHVDTIDFYSSKMRRQLQQDICNHLEELPQTIEQDIAKILILCEAEQPKADNNALEATGTQISQADKDIAVKFGRDKNLVSEILADYEKIGFVGKSEDSNKLLCYLSATSRKMGEGNVLSVIILSSSGAGKSKLQDSTLNLMPNEELEKLTNLSGKALFYREKESLKNKILALEEKTNNKDADYAIRMLLSSNQLISEVTIRDTDGRMTTQTNVVDANCTSVFFTSTNPNLDMETSSRFFTIAINESEEQTKAIIEHQMNEFSLEGLTADAEIESIKNKHRNFQRLLKNYRVVNPFKIKFNDTRLQSRRLFRQILNLINAVAFLRQMQKAVKVHGEIEYIEVDKSDIETALRLAKNILSKSLNELSGPSHNLLKQIDSYLEKQKRIYAKENKGEAISKSEIFFTRKEIRLAIKWSSTRLHTYLRELQNLEYVVLEHGKKNSLQHYRLIYDADGKFTWLNNVASMMKIEQ
jgi:DNA primase